MDKMMDTGWPYRFCEKCAKLSPIEPMSSELARCMICSGFIDDKTGGRTVYLSIEEARLRRLEIV